MLTWTSVVATAPTDSDIAAVVAARSALTIRPLIEFGPLRRAMGLPTVDDRTGDVQAAAATAASTGRRRSAGSAKTAAPRSTSRTAATKQSKPKTAGASTKPKSAKARSAATTATARTPDTAAA